MTKVHLSLLQFDRKKDIDGDGSLWTLLDAYTSLKESRKLANEVRKEGAPWGKKTGGFYNARLLNVRGYHLVYYRKVK